MKKIVIWIDGGICQEVYALRDLYDLRGQNKPFTVEVKVIDTDDQSEDNDEYQAEIEAIQNDPNYVKIY